jgi:hypothetical protein
MTILYINTGSGANAGNGDSLRTAFNKVNSNFTNVTLSLNNTAKLVQSSRVPTAVNTNTIWYDTVGGRSYIFYDGTWVDASPNVEYLPTATTSTLGGVKVDGTTIQISNTGTISVNGVVGAQGVQGATGAQGGGGAPGVQGSQGYQGGSGGPGVQGAQGVQGGSGGPGVQGAQGNQGGSGGPGVQGAAGSQGATGVQGAQGAQGAVGNANLPIDAAGFLYDDGAGVLSWSNPYSLTSATNSFTLSADGIVRLNGNVFLPGNGGTATTSTLINTVSTSTLKIVAPPLTVYGSLTDIAGNVAFDNSFIYYCTGTFGTLYSPRSIQTATNISRVYVRQSDFASAPQNGWLIQNSSGGTVYTISSVFTGVFFSPPPTVAYYQLNISTSSLTHTTSTVYNVGPGSTTPIWLKTPWNAIASTSTSIVSKSTPGIVTTGTDVILGNLKAQIAASGNSSIQLSLVAGSLTVDGSEQGVSNGIAVTTNVTALSLTTSPAYFNAVSNYIQPGDVQVAHFTDRVGSGTWRVTAQIGYDYTNNSVTIEKLA